jgi:phosphatidylinositol alpha-1,6-mannosyltransferase
MSRHLLVTADYPPRPGGQARYLCDLWGGLPRSEATILAPRPGAEASTSAGPGIIRLPIPLGSSRTARVSRTALFSIHAVSRARRLRVSAVHAGQVIATGTAALVCHKLLGLPYSLVVHGADLLEFADRPPTRRLVRAILGNAGRIIANSRFTAGEAARHGAPVSRIRVVHPVVDASRFLDRRNAAGIRSRFGLASGSVLLTVGRLVPRKGHDTVLRALPALLRTRGDLHYLVVGDGPDRVRLERLAAELGVANSVTFAGHVPDDDLPAFYAASDLFVMVSRERPDSGDVEGFGIVYLEASASGRAVVAGLGGGVGDAVEDGVSGIMVPPDDPGALAGAVARLLSNDMLRERLARDGRRRVLERFSRENGRAALTEVLDDLVRAC